MLKELVRLLTDKKTLLDEMSNDFSLMLRISREMYTLATGVLFGIGDKKDVWEQVFPADKQLNKLEREIRRKVVMHIAVSGSDNVSSMLIFMSIIKDAERVGDYIKNIYDLLDKLDAFGSSSIGKQAAAMTNDVRSKLEEISNLFESNDAKKGQVYVTDSIKLMDKCDLLIAELLNNGKTKSPVAYALYFRYMKRIIAHTSNIATSIFMPVDKLDFFDELLDKKAKTIKPCKKKKK